MSKSYVNELVGHNHEGYVPVANTIWSRKYLIEFNEESKSQAFMCPTFDRKYGASILFIDNKGNFHFWLDNNKEGYARTVGVIRNLETGEYIATFNYIR